MILGEELKPPLSELAHHGIKGMKWGVRKASGPSSSEVTAARDRHNDRMNRLDTEATRLSFAKTNAEKQRVLKGIHSISNEKGADQDADVATHITRGERVSTAILAGPIGSHIQKKNMAEQRSEAHQYLNAYRNSTVLDYHDASK